MRLGLGISLNQSSPPPSEGGGGEPEFPPSSSTSAVDFVNEQYWDGATTALTISAGTPAQNKVIVDFYDDEINMQDFIEVDGLFLDEEAEVLPVATFAGNIRNALLDAGGFTAVIYFITTNANAEQELLAVYNSSPGGEHKRVRLQGGVLYAQQYDGDSTDRVIASAFVPTSNVTHRVAVTFSPTETSMQWDSNALETMAGLTVPDTMTRADVASADSSGVLSGRFKGMAVYAPIVGASLSGLNPLPGLAA